jgi:hypothetical protein
MNLMEKEMYEGHLKDLRQQIETLTDIIKMKS